MLKFPETIRREAVRTPLTCLAALGGGFLLSLGNICSVPSPLPAVLAGIVHPLSSFCILIGSVLAFLVLGGGETMYFSLLFLTFSACLRFALHGMDSPQRSAVLTAMAGVPAGFGAELMSTHRSGILPFYILEALLCAGAVYFLSDGKSTLLKEKKICLDKGSGFTFAMIYLLGITALCGLDLTFCNPGRAFGMAVTLMAAKKFRQTGGTLCASLTVCGTSLCSVSLGTPLLFLPVAGMLAGFLYRLPDALLIPVFFLLQMLGSLAFDGSHELARITAELLIGCCLFGVCSRMDVSNYIRLRRTEPASALYFPQREQFLSGAFLHLRREASSVMGRLKPEESEEEELAAKGVLCTGCRNASYCWQQRKNATETAFRTLFHHPDMNPKPEALDGCLRRSRITESFLQCSRSAAMTRLQNAHLFHARSGLLQYLQILEEITAAASARHRVKICETETEELRDILRTCGCSFTECFVRRLRSGRFAAEIYTRESELPLSALREMLSNSLDVFMEEIPVQKSETGSRFCFCEKPPYSLRYAVRSVNAPAQERCGDSYAVVTDCEGSCCIILSDGMGSGNIASLTSRLAVHTFTRLIGCGLPAEITIRLINTMLLCETGMEHFTTLDILCMDADTATLRLYKSGAAPTLHYRNRQMTAINASSLPVGILSDAEPFRQEIRGCVQDRIIMLSDGIREEEYPYIRELLLQEGDLSSIAAAVCEKASLYSGGGQADDMTVIAAAVIDSRTQPAEKEKKTVKMHTGNRKSDFVHNA